MTMIIVSPVTSPEKPQCMHLTKPGTHDDVQCMCVEKWWMTSQLLNGTDRSSAVDNVNMYLNKYYYSAVINLFHAWYSHTAPVDWCNIPHPPRRVSMVNSHLFECYRDQGGTDVLASTGPAGGIGTAAPAAAAPADAAPADAAHAAAAAAAAAAALLLPPMLPLLLLQLLLLLLLLLLLPLLPLLLHARCCCCCPSSCCCWNAAAEVACSQMSPVSCFSVKISVNRPLPPVYWVCLSVSGRGVGLTGNRSDNRGARGVKFPTTRWCGLTVNILTDRQ